MSIAEIRGKIGHLGQNLSDHMEDLLTSDVFSSCRYTRPNTLLIPFLLQARTKKNKKFDYLSVGQVKKVDYFFWPRLRKTEPDVLINLELLSGKFYIILIEAKYLSGKSNTSSIENDISNALSSFDQLAKEYFDLLDNAVSFLNLHESNIAGKALFYVTAHRSIPTESMKESLDEIIEKLNSEEDDIQLFWLSWFELFPLLIQQEDLLDWEKPILEDLKLLLIRKQFIHFNGFHSDVSGKISKDQIYCTFFLLELFTLRKLL